MIRHLSMKEAHRILENYFGPMSYRTFLKYYKSHEMFLLHVRQSGLKNPKIARADLEKFVNYVKTHRFEFEKWMMNNQ